MALAEAYNVALMPHSPYFGPGYWATLQLKSTGLPVELAAHLGSQLPILVPTSNPALDRSTPQINSG